ncbi:DUF1479 domain protein [Geopyxis carbonaria]|nr:DUF1479 domain protein [Geopyxis carbonaria]
MICTASRLRAVPRLLTALVPTRRALATATSTPPAKAAGDISSVFPSLSGASATPLPPRFAALKASLLAAHPEALTASWNRLLPALASTISELRERGSDVIPSLPFSAITSGTVTAAQTAEIRKRGVVVLRGVIPEAEALALKAEAQRYIADNRERGIKAFPAANPAVYELYWSPSQVKARADRRMLTAQRWLQQLWHASPETAISTRTPLTYADRLRIRPPGDTAFALGPHVDGGSLERWEDATYRACYSEILRGEWEAHDAFDATHRVGAKMDMYNGAGACAMFRMWQGWLSMSDTGPGEGTLRVFPELKVASAYLMLRPLMEVAGAAAEWPGSMPGMCQELRSDVAGWHPHLALQDGGMVSVPRVAPGDYVAWHCDTVHAVETEHRGAGDSSVLYIPATPLCESNAAYLAWQREAAERGTPAPDFPGAGGEQGEKGFRGAVDWEELGEEGRRAMGMGNVGWSTEGLEGVEKDVVDDANKIVFGIRK